MDRTEFLKLCLATSKLENSVMKIKKNVPEYFKVTFNEIRYYAIGYELLFIDGRVVHSAILHDLKANSITHAKLSEVEWLLERQNTTKE